MRIVLIGPPGVGKGTQTLMLEERTGMKPLSSGAIFREEIAKGSELGKRAKQYLDQGQLVPDEVTIGMMVSRATSPDVAASGFMLDGFPRTVAQAEALDCALEKAGTPIDRVIALEVDQTELIRRLSGRISCRGCSEIYHRDTRPPKVEGVCDNCGSELYIRSDDQPDAIAERLRVYSQNTKPVLDFYSQAGRSVSIDGTKSPEEVFEAIMAALAA